MNRGYGFIDAGPADRVFVVTGDNADIARNHCAATMLANLMLCRYGEGAVCRNRRELFRGIHRIIGNGPILRLDRRANRYLAGQGVPLVCRQINRRVAEAPDRLVQLVQRELDAGRPCGLMVAESLWNWHWVLVLGAKLDPSGAVCFCIADGWHARRVFHYMPDHGSRLLAIATFEG